MAAEITLGAVGSTASVPAAGSVSVVASGDFGGVRFVEVEIIADSLSPAKVHTFKTGDGVTVDSKTGQVVKVTVTGATGGSGISVSII